MNNIEETVRLIAIKMSFEAFVKKMEENLKTTAKKLGIDIDLTIDCKVNSVNLETWDREYKNFMLGIEYYTNTDKELGN